MELPLDIFSPIITHLDYFSLINFLQIAKVFYYSTCPLVLEAVHSVFIKLVKSINVNAIALYEYPQITIGFNYGKTNYLYTISDLYNRLDKINKPWNHIFIQFEFKSKPKIENPKLRIYNTDIKLFYSNDDDPHLGHTLAELPIDQLTILHFIHPTFMKISPTIEMYRNCLTFDTLRVMGQKLSMYVHNLS